MQESPEVHVLPKDALIPVEIGVGFLNRLQKMLIFLLDGKTEEEIEQLKKHAENDTIPEDSWMFHFKTIQDLVFSVEQIAIDKKLTVLKPLDEAGPDLNL